MKAPFELKSSHVCEKRSKEEEVFFVNMESYFSVIAGITLFQFLDICLMDFWFREQNSNF